MRVVVEFLKFDQGFSSFDVFGVLFVYLFFIVKNLFKIYLYMFDMYIWMFPKIVIPPNHPFD